MILSEKLAQVQYVGTIMSLFLMHHMD